MKLTHYTYSCDSLTNFGIKAHEITGNGNRLKKKKILYSDLGGFKQFGTTVCAPFLVALKKKDYLLTNLVIPNSHPPVTSIV